MSAYIVVDLTPKDTNKIKEYSALAAETLLPFGGKFLAKGPVESLHIASSFQMKVIISFPDKEKASAWYNSDAYQEIIELRNEAMDSQFDLIG